MIAASSVIWIRQFHEVLFTWIHVALAISALVVLLLHLWLAQPANKSLEAKIPLSIAAIVWIASMLYRCVRARGVRADIIRIKDRVEPHAVWPYTGAALIEVKLFKTVAVHPGAYFYLYFEQCGWRRYRGEPMMVYGWEAASPAATWKRNSKHMKGLTFLVQDRPQLSNLLSKPDIAVTVDGPYGRDPQLHKFDTVSLIAEGIGILGILPLVIYLAERNYHDSGAKEIVRKYVAAGETPDNDLLSSIHRDRTRRIDVIWIMRDTCEFSWAIEKLEYLAKLDPRRVGTTV